MSERCKKDDSPNTGCQQHNFIGAIPTKGKAMAFKRFPFIQSQAQTQNANSQQASRDKQQTLRLF